MQPNQPPPAPPPAAPPVANGPEKPLNPYDFLSAKPVKQKGGMGPTLPSGNSTIQRLLIVLGIIVFLVVAFIIFMSVLGSAGKENTDNLVAVAKQQTELIRVAGVGVDKAKLDATQNLALTTKLSLQTDQPALLDAIKKAGTKVNPKVLAAGNAKTDAALAQAEQDNTFDTVFMQIITKELTDYQAALKKAYDSASGKKLKDSLNVDYGHINLIIGTDTK